MTAPFPDGATDTHIHVYDHRFPVAPTAVLRPPDASVADYRELQAELGLSRAVVVQPSTYGFDNRCQLDAIAALGALSARGVMVVDSSTAPDELARLTTLGARGARFHMITGGAVPWSELAPTAASIAEHEWHVQLQLNGRELAERLPELLALPCPLVVDHIGRFMPPVDIDHPSWRALLTLVDAGRCWVKLSAPYESTTDGAPHYPTVSGLACALVARAPERMLWASNWPHPGQAYRPDAAVLATLLDTWTEGDRDVQRQILVDNAAEVYGF
jgi:D-galactarolactone isomerase